MTLTLFSSSSIPYSTMKVDVWLTAVVIVLFSIVVCVIGPNADGSNANANGFPGGAGSKTAGPADTPARAGAVPMDDSPAAGSKNPTNTSPKPKANIADVNCTAGNSTASNCEKSSIGKKLTEIISKNRGMLMRTLYVLIGVTAVVIVYFLLRTCR